MRIDISREPRSGSLIGNLWLDDAAGRRLERTLGDPSCPALVQALSLVVALSADESAPAAGAAADAEHARPAPADEWGTAPDPFAAEAMDERPSQRGDRFALGPLVLASVQSALGPEPLVGVGLGAVANQGGKYARDSADPYTNGSLAAFIVGGSFGVATAIFGLVTTPSATSEAKVVASPWVLPGGGGVGASWRF